MCVCVCVFVCFKGSRGCGEGDRGGRWLFVWTSLFLPINNDVLRFLMLHLSCSDCWIRFSVLTDQGLQLGVWNDCTTSICPCKVKLYSKIACRFPISVCVSCS